MASVLKFLRGRRAGWAADDRLINFNGFSAGENGSQFNLADPARVTELDDFLGDVIPDEWGVHTGSDGAAVAFATNVANGGTVRGVMGAGAGVTMAANGVQLERALNWYAGNGDLVLQARVKLALITSVALFVGFTDQLSALEMPFTLSSGSLTSNATDAVGFLFDTAATAATWKGVGVANDVDATVLELTSLAGVALAPVAATYNTLRVVISTAGVATFFIDGVQVGQISAAVTPTIALTPVIAGFRRTATITQLDVDYVYTSMLRV